MRRLVSEMRGVFSICDTSTATKFAAAFLQTLPRGLSERSFAPADQRMAGRTCRFEIAPRAMIELDGRAFGLARELYVRRVYFAIPGFDLRPDDVVVDLGANVGVFTTMAAKLSRRVVAVEALPEYIPVIQDHLRRNGVADRATVIHGLLSPGTGMLADARLRSLAGQATVATLSELLDAQGITRVDFLKMDIEGSEFDVFQSAANWLPRVQRLAMEVHPPYGDVSGLLRQLRESGMKCWVLNSSLQEVERLTGRDGFIFGMRT